MRVEERIAAYARSCANGLTLDTVCIGVGYTGGMLSDGSGGVSYTFRESLGSSCGVIRQAGKLKGLPAEELVGWFCPLVWKYQKAKEFYIFERDPLSCVPSGTARRMDSETAYEILPKCTKVVLTGTSFINKTADRLLAACKNAKEIILVGTSTPMCPEVLKEYGVTVLAGTQITDAEQMLRIVAEGGGGMDLSPASEKLLERIS